MKASELFILLALIISQPSCKKEDSNYRLTGVVTDGKTGSALPATNVSVMKQVVANGTFSTTFTTAATDITNGSGQFEMSWARENFSALKLVAERSQYITREVALDVSSFSAGNTVTRNTVLYPEAFIQVHVANTGAANPADLLNFTFTNAYFDCNCCSNGYRVFEGSSIDSTFQCRLYGDTWIKYQWQVFTADTDTTITDSIFCPSFQTTAVDITY